MKTTSGNTLSQSTIAGTEVHVWPVDLDETDGQLPLAVSYLSDAEKKRMTAFRFDRLAHRYAASHAVLRILLARYSGVPIREIAFHTGRHGKPSLVHPANLFFNISDAGGFGLYAFTVATDVGIDLEQIEPIKGDLESLARFVLSSSELSGLFALPPAGRLVAFLKCWTRKEAILKATGWGLAMDVNTIDGATSDLRLLTTNPAHGGLNGRQWALHDLEPAPGYVGAVACDTSKTVRLFDPAPAGGILGWVQ